MAQLTFVTTSSNDRAVFQCVLDSGRVTTECWDKDTVLYAMNNYESLASIDVPFARENAQACMDAITAIG